MSDFYVDILNVTGVASDANVGSEAAPWLTITNGATAARIATGDVIHIGMTPNPQLVDSKASWTQGSRTITLSGAVPLVVLAFGPRRGPDRRDHCRDRLGVGTALFVVGP